MDIFSWGSLSVVPSYGAPDSPLPVAPREYYEAGELNVQAMALGGNTFDGLAPWVLRYVPCDNEAELQAWLTSKLGFPGYTSEMLDAIVALYDPVTK